MTRGTNLKYIAERMSETFANTLSDGLQECGLPPHHCENIKLDAQKLMKKHFDSLISNADMPDATIRNLEVKHRIVIAADVVLDEAEKQLQGVRVGQYKENILRKAEELCSATDDNLSTFNVPLISQLINGANVSLREQMKLIKQSYTDSMKLRAAAAAVAAAEIPPRVTASPSFAGGQPAVRSEKPCKYMVLDHRLGKLVCTRDKSGTPCRYRHEGSDIRAGDVWNLEMAKNVGKRKFPSSYEPDSHKQ